MLLGIMLLYVGAVLAVNGIWLVGQARAATGQATEQLAGRSEAAVAADPTFIQGREVAVLNVFTGFIGVVIAVTLLVQGNTTANLAFARGSGFILLFAFTYLWVAANQFLDSGGHAFGWYCLFVAITAVAAGAYQLSNTSGTANVWLGINWFAWALLWFLFWVLLSLERPIGKLAGYLAILEGIGTCWILGFLVLQGTLHF